MCAMFSYYFCGVSVRFCSNECDQMNPIPNKMDKLLLINIKAHCEFDRIAVKFKSNSLNILFHSCAKFRLAAW